MSPVRDKDAQKLQQRIGHWVRALSRRSRSSRRHHGSKQLANPRALDHSRLPPELWLLILREATYTYPDPLDTSGETSFLDGTNLHLPAYYASMRFKTDLSLVSKRWNALVKTYLYEFVWISRAVQAKTLAHTLLLEFVEGIGSSGRFIRRLHIETPVLERCAPADLHVILEYSPQLAIYTDHQSIQRNRYEAAPDPRCSPERLLSLLAHPKCELRRLAWTSYDDVPFHERMSPLLEMRTMRLEYLELSSCSLSCDALFGEPGDAGAGAAMRVSLPALRSLKANLDNGMFAVLASWDLPALRNLSVVSADFSYTGAGFFRFFAAHGAGLRQLELGHSSSMVEEHYLTSAQPRRAAGMDPLSVARWCPNLRELVCSADAEWHWEQPDWIAPHVLLPCHPALEMIAVRDMDARIAGALEMLGPGGRTDADTAFFPLLEQMGSLLRREAFPALKYVRDLSAESDRMRTQRPLPAVVGFWEKVLRKCQARDVWLEDHAGVNITSRALMRASRT